MNNNHNIRTYSIVACDLKEKTWGVAVASKFFAVGAVVPFAKAGVGAIATQSDANVSYGKVGLKLLSQGKKADEVLKNLLNKDNNIDERQVGIVDSHGNSATFTGNKCTSWSGGINGKDYAIQGNTLVGEQTVKEMDKAYKNTKGDLAHRLYAALLAGDITGGDKRGKQSACLIVVKEKGGYGGYTDRYLDLRIDDHKTPVQELGNLLKLHDLYFSLTPKDQKVKINSDLTIQLQKTMKDLGYYSGDINGMWNEMTKEGFRNFTSMENLEERVDPINGLIDPPALQFLKERFLK